MSDFIYSNTYIDEEQIKLSFQEIYGNDHNLIHLFNGSWGSFAFLSNHYEGFDYYETDDQITAMLGGPLLDFAGLTDLSISENEKTKAISLRYSQENMSWDNDLNGPFQFIYINKRSGEITVVTDMMSFIPAYEYSDDKCLMISSHLSLIKACKPELILDQTSVGDFVLHSIVTYPYTMYKGVYQLQPASVHQYHCEAGKQHKEPYWVPYESNAYKSLNEAAQDLKNSLDDYVKNVIADHKQVAQFISGGEDSRSISSIIRQFTRSRSFIFLDQMNREGRVAKKAAEAYGIEFNLVQRDKLHYLNILEEGSQLVGHGAQYTHAHSLGLHNKCGLSKYPAVFGGLFSDALLKGARIKKVRGIGRFPFLPQIKDKMYNPEKVKNTSALKKEIIGKIEERRKEHLSYIKEFRKESASEWFELWPSSMNLNIVNIHVNRRLFQSYEPFMSNDVVKISALVPQKWKKNRKLFHRAMQPHLKKTKWLKHGDGRLPYFPWYVNSFVQFFFWSIDLIGRKTKVSKIHPGPWGDSNNIKISEEYQEKIQSNNELYKSINQSFTFKLLNELFTGNNLRLDNQLNLLQTLHLIKLESNRNFYRDEKVES
ncbi:hypothetical protein C6I21_08085 [Alkalicoccus urumqiensis]|uniref:asparagine synthase (glutamine-hydrolyzing) n=2 Tax=Alkalicoccus urumqiensis TaxID=1548213 RepID=A0A2P6MHT7_ALKUR|nr:hypothetical protein C6I21_08085 [Alkalicoccus urumqiensis]